MEQQMLLNSARAYVMMARELQEHGYDGRHYLLRAKDCLDKYRLLNQNELTIFIKMAA